MEHSKDIIFYDGDCGFCNFWVQWILEKDTKNQFNFSALQNETGQRFLMKNNFNTKEFNTLYLLTSDGIIYEKSDAIIKVANILGEIYYVFNLGKIFPKFLRDKIYDEISQNRQKLAAAKCLLPTPEERKRFI